MTRRAGISLAVVMIMVTRVGAEALSHELVRRQVSTAHPAGVIITDDVNPIDRARDETALEWRRRTMSALK